MNELDLKTLDTGVYEEIDLRDSEAGQIVAAILNPTGNEMMNWAYDQDDVDVMMFDGRVIKTTSHNLKIYLAHKIRMGLQDNPTVRGWTDWSSSALSETSYLTPKDVNARFKEIGSDKDYALFQRFLMHFIKDTTDHSEDLLTPELYNHIYSTELASALNIPHDNWTDYQSFLKTYKERLEEERYWTENGCPDDDQEAS